MFKVQKAKTHHNPEKHNSKHVLWSIWGYYGVNMEYQWKFSPSSVENVKKTE